MKPPALTLRHTSTMLAWRLLLVLPLFLPAAAQASETPLRDPMRPPAVTAPRTAVAAGDAGGPALVTLPRHLLTVEGRRYVIDGGRRRAVGDLLGVARIERIEDSAVVVRHAGVLQRLPLYGGVVKRPVSDPAASAPAGPRTALAPSSRMGRDRAPVSPGETR